MHGSGYRSKFPEFHLWGSVGLWGVGFEGWRSGLGWIWIVVWARSYGGRVGGGSGEYREVGGRCGRGGLESDFPVWAMGVM